MKLIELISEHQERNEMLSKNELYFTFEFAPLPNSQQLQRLLRRIEILSTLEPLSIDFTSSKSLKLHEMIKISAQTQLLRGLETVYQISYRKKNRKEIIYELEKIKSIGIQNVMIRTSVLSEEEKQKPYITSEIEVIKLIREIHNDYFSLLIEIDLELYKSEEDFQILKQIILNGVDLLRTLPFYDCSKFLNFRQKCRKIEINCPIIPVILPINDYKSATIVIQSNKIQIPEEIMNGIEKLKNEPEPFLEYGIKITIELCQTLLKHKVRGFHFITLNKEDPIKRILEGLDLIQSSRIRRKLPWRKSTDPRRKYETVRPIFWTKRPISYTLLTSNWKKYPRFAWSEIQNEKGVINFKEQNQDIYTKINAPNISLKDLGVELNSEYDVEKVFVDYYQGKRRSIPWNQNKLDLENLIIQNKLITVAQRGLMVINSQPRINSVSSEDLRVGFGGYGGYIFQKRYLEFFFKPSRIKKLLNAIKDNPNIRYYSTNHDASVVYTNIEKMEPTTLTWGVFSHSIIQTTVADPYTFHHSWRKEAFALWLWQWGYKYKDGSKSRKIIQNIHDTYFLVYIVDNDFIHSSVSTEQNVWKVLGRLFAEEDKKKSKKVNENNINDK
ncbi:methylenetetrahydrofolate reductase [Anaeramoeba flamelloides]|uniref:Methylenetetrahydrofolate reductase n=1 Tax=Anaeramoeba flamelloides TaxID=1746091 RepID=A0AAV8ACI9_9EUKA|nr:methylenetetrahydrofolate reductase [Anaeramoeba flamelloides]KAJ6231640.1 methylenetetrahydrofolate reductase [Anaeramoeba flamelloides]